MVALGHIHGFAAAAVRLRLPLVAFLWQRRDGNRQVRPASAQLRHTVALAGFEKMFHLLGDRHLSLDRSGSSSATALLGFVILSKQIWRAKGVE